MRRLRTVLVVLAVTVAAIAGPVYGHFVATIAAEQSPATMASEISRYLS